MPLALNGSWSHCERVFFLTLVRHSAKIRQPIRWHSWNVLVTIIAIYLFIYLLSRSQFRWIKSVNKDTDLKILYKRWANATIVILVHIAAKVPDVVFLWMCLTSEKHDSFFWFFLCTASLEMGCCEHSWGLHNIELCRIKNIHAYQSCLKMEIYSDPSRNTCEPRWNTHFYWHMRTHTQD